MLFCDLKKYVWVYMYVCVCIYACTHVLRPEDFRNAVHLLYHWVAHRLGAHQSDKSGCPSSLRDPCFHLECIGFTEICCHDLHFSWVLGTKLRCSCLQGKCFSTTVLSPHPFLLSFFPFSLPPAPPPSPLKQCHVCRLQAHSLSHLFFGRVELELHVCATKPWPLTCFPRTRNDFPSKYRTTPPTVLK